MYDFDDWYIEAKLDLASGYVRKSRADSSIDQIVPFQPILAVAPISFHYVSQAESHLLYSILLNSSTATTTTGTTSSKWASAGAAVRSGKELLAAWPSTDSSVGHYSRKLKMIDEADLLFKYLTTLTISDIDCKL